MVAMMGRWGMEGEGGELVLRFITKGDTQHGRVGRSNVGTTLSRKKI